MNKFDQIVEIVEKIIIRLIIIVIVIGVPLYIYGIHKIIENELVY